ncbi:hypothetical protein TNCV_1946161 [Trichonephila clavipes]|uniref:Transposase n=1 Tax=Trichonephila clavipes TaxID=2585209 RepID=A0A8X6SKH6_TRICX|nr:hypothetical protein TNCV_1946161 [Trichonephila clavipes]
MVQRSREHEQKQLNINGTENILLENCNTMEAQNYVQKSSGSPDSEATWNSLRSEKFLACIHRFLLVRKNKRILFSDEAHFWLNGYLNKQNCRIWSEANPQVYVETPLHLEKLTVWCALWAGGILLQKR